MPHLKHFFFLGTFQFVFTIELCNVFFMLPSSQLAVFGEKQMEGDRSLLDRRKKAHHTTEITQTRLIDRNRTTSKTASPERNILIFYGDCNLSIADT